MAAIKLERWPRSDRNKWPPSSESAGPAGADLFDGEKTDHVSFPAAGSGRGRQTRDGVTSTSELGVMALAMLAHPDPVAAFFRRTEGAANVRYEAHCGQSVDVAAAELRKCR